MKVIDAQNKILGRVASEAAMALMGKHKASYEPQKITGEDVHIINASKLKFSDKKLRESEYKRYTGFPSGLKSRTLGEVITKKGYGEVIAKAVRGMIPANKLRTDILKKLKVTD